MEQIMRLRSVILILSLVFTRLQSQPVKQSVTVTADGYSYLGEDETLRQAKLSAMQDAERNAVEKGTGVYVESFSSVNQSVLMDDEILAVAGGYLSGKKVLIDRLEAEPPRYHVQIEAEVKCGDLQKLMEAKKAEKKAEKQILSVDFACVAERLLADGTWGEINVLDGGELRSFDKFQIHIQPRSDCHAYLILYDSSGKASLLFPTKETGGSAFLKRGIEKKVPGKNMFYELDDKTGVETLYLLASPVALADVEWLLEKMGKAGTDTTVGSALTRSLTTRGIGRIVPGAKADFILTGGAKVEKVTETVTGRGTFVKKLGFRHSARSGG
jgi:hypothetical protein